MLGVPLSSNVVHRADHDFSHDSLVAIAAEAPETASAYYRYGAALLYSVQDSADVFGGDMQTAAQQHDEQARAPTLSFTLPFSAPALATPLRPLSRPTSRVDLVRFRD